VGKPIQSIVEDILSPYLQANGFELVDIEYVKEGKNRFLRVFVDKEGGIDIEECSRISEYLSQKLDEIDPIPEAYFLEVSSPGAERPLKKAKDFYRAIHKNVHVTTYEPVNGRKEFEGEMVAYDEKQLVIEDNGERLAIPVDKVAHARLAIIL
jgi:ribosome maturation factor RimP